MKFVPGGTLFQGGEGGTMQKEKEATPSRKRRWYDKREGLSAALDKLRSADGDRREIIIEGVREIVTRRDPNFIDKVCDQFPLNPFRRRWYDDNPYLWLVVNSLRYADDETLNEVVAFIRRG
jgi:hypothetical protein